MPRLGRREFLILSGSATGGAASTALLGRAARAQAPARGGATSILYDATRCIGCRACMRACREANELKPDLVSIGGTSYDLPRDLSERNWMVIQVFRRPARAGKPGSWSFVKRACMHCNEPACASACPVAALRKTPEGPVVYDESRCIGCRYCQLACPYSIPRYEWVARKPRVRKCKLCLACVGACPTGALAQGTRRELLAEAHRRIHDHPKRYVHHVYGEHEAGGASRLILSAIPLEQAGFPKLPSTTRSRYADAVMGSLPGWIVGVALVLGGVHRVMKRAPGDEEAARGDAKGAGG
jgi:Fe-S-cluster-containing dehydrogenase component